MTTISQWWMWVGFITFIASMLAMDFFFLGGRKAHRVSTREALGWTLTWVLCALIFNLLFWLYLSHTFDYAIANQKALEFFTGYLIEKSLSVDNIFVFIIIFNYFAIPAEYQRRVLLYGVIGAILMRLLLILLGIWLVSKFFWVLYIFGIFLVATGIRMFWFAKATPKLAKNPVLRWMRNHLRITEELHKEKFILWQKGSLFVTPLFIVLVLIETSDIFFAVDSIPAIFAVTSDPFIVFTSNIFAILGLRAMYFLLFNMAERFRLLKYGVAIIMILVGCKMLLAQWYKVPILIMLIIIVTILFVCILLSILQDKKRQS